MFDAIKSYEIKMFCKQYVEMFSLSENNLKKEGYLSILNNETEEPYAIKRLNWLRSKMPEMNPPLMFEQSIVEFINSPTLQTVIQVVLPLFYAASFRAFQDSQCSTASLVNSGKMMYFMKNVYYKTLSEKTIFYLKRNLKEIVQENENEIYCAVSLKVLKVAKSTLKKDLQFPEWIENYHQNIHSQELSLMRSGTNCNEYRQIVASQEIKRIKNPFLMTYHLLTNDVASFCNQQLNEMAMIKIRKEAKQKKLSNIENLEKNLKNQEYVEVLKGIWNKRDQEILDWLRSKSSELHIPLIFEQAILEFENQPTIETLVDISIPLLQAANFRASQDSQCSIEFEICQGTIRLQMYNIYCSILEMQIEDRLNKTLSEIIVDSSPLITINAHKKVSEIAQISLMKELPSPEWIKGCRESFHDKEILMHSDKEIKEIRDKLAYSEIRTISNLLGLETGNIHRIIQEP